MGVSALPRCGLSPRHVFRAISKLSVPTMDDIIPGPVESERFGWDSMPARKLGWAFAAAAGAATLWSISGVFGKILMAGAVSPSQLVFYRSALGSFLLLTFLL